MSTVVVPILGVSQRSGTHWLADLLSCHSDCRPAVGRPGRAGSGWEDLLLEQSATLADYVRDVRTRWGAGFQDDPAMGQRLLRHLGDGLLEFVAIADGDVPGPSTHVVTKSPTVAGLDRVASLWPSTRPVVLVRDARAVVASAIRTFGGSPERWTRVWREGARMIVRCRAADQSGQLLLVRYEDLQRDLLPEMARIWAHVGLDPGGFDEQAAGSLPVRGSSETANEGGGVHWDPVPATEGFTPLHRGEQLTTPVLERIRWLAGAELEAFGYDVGAARPGWHGQRGRDAAWAIARWGRRAPARLRPWAS